MTEAWLHLTSLEESVELIRIIEQMDTVQATIGNGVDFCMINSIAINDHIPGAI